MMAYRRFESKPWMSQEILKAALERMQRVGACEMEVRNRNVARIALHVDGALGAREKQAPIGLMGLHQARQRYVRPTVHEWRGAERGHSRIDVMKIDRFF